MNTNVQILEYKYFSMEKSYRKSLYEKIKACALEEKCFNKYKKNFTQCSNQQLVDLLTQYAQDEESENEKIEKSDNKVQEKNETCGDIQIEDLKKVLVTPDVLKYMVDAFETLLEKSMQNLALSIADNICDKLEEKFKNLVEKEILTNLSLSDETECFTTNSGYMYGEGVRINPKYTLRWKKSNSKLGENLGSFSLPERFKQKCY